MEKNNENITFEELLNQTLKEIKVGQTVTGKIVEVSPQKEIFVDIGYKADGIIPANEYFINEGEKLSDKFKLGDRITAVVLKLNDGLGNVLLSYNKARKEIDKKEFESRVNNDTVFTSVVSEVNDKGLITYFNTIKIFIPLSQSMIKRSEDPHTYKGKQIKFKIIEYNPKTNKIIGSIKKIFDEERKEKSDEFWNNVEVGKLYTGTVTSLSEYGAFVDIDGVVQGLLHISEMTWERDKKPKDILEVGQQIKVRVKEVDKENKRLKLIYDKKGPDPWENIEEKYKISDVIPVKVVHMVPFGAFVKIDKGIEGLIHISQISTKRIAKPEDVLKIGQKVNAQIISIDKENRKIELSIKAIEGTSKDLELTDDQKKWMQVQDNKDIAVSDENKEIAIQDENKELAVKNEENK